MPSCVFNTCCGCIELRTGCLIIGYLELIKLIVYGMVYMLGVDVNGFKEEENPTLAAVEVYLTVIIGIILIIFFLAGIYKNKSRYVRTYMTLLIICLVKGIAQLIFGIGRKSPVTISIYVISFAFEIFFLMVIRSYYYKMDGN